MKPCQRYLNNNEVKTKKKLLLPFVICKGIGDGHDFCCDVLAFLNPACDNGLSNDEQRTGNGGRFCCFSFGGGTAIFSLLVASGLWNV